MQQLAGEPAPEGTDDGAAEARGEAEMEPSDRRGSGPDKLAHGPISPIDHPTFASRRLRREAAKVGRRFRPPVRPPKKIVELEARIVKNRREPLRESRFPRAADPDHAKRSEEHTSELQSPY